jgi:cell division protease FtsH
MAVEPREQQRESPAPPERPPAAPQRKPEQRSRMRPRFWVIVLVLLALNYLSVALFAPGKERSVRIPYSPEFLTQVRDGNVTKISSTGETVSGELKQSITYPPSDKEAEPAKNFDTEIPTFANTDELDALLREKNVEISAEPVNPGRGTLSNLILSFGPVLLLVALFVWLARRSGGAASALGNFGRSRARRVEGGTTNVTFADVAGIDESKSELTEVVDYLKNPDRYRRLGGRIPRGVLLSGRPGTGKTLLARAVAGEAGVPFFSVSASEFVEAIVGIGASRVRDLFKQAKEASPAIIFIDELDAIGRSRSAGSSPFSGGNDEREQTLNQILTEMDGFESGEAVIVLGATNRPEILDHALLRPGRFDRRVTVPPPDKDGRRQILQVHTRSIPLADDVDLDGLAASTPGMVGADLANLANEAALLAARRAHERVQRADFTDALEKIILGAPRSVVLSQEDRRRTAYHESGHALVGMLTPGADPVRKVSIIPRGMALGVTLSAPDVEKSNYEESYLLGRIKVALGGRVAEEVVYGSITAGAESDIQQLTAIARQMVGRWGMSESIGPIAVLPSDGQGPLLPGASEVSQATQEIVDREVRRIVDGAHAEVTRLLTEHRAKLDSLTDALMEAETLDEADAYEAAGVHRDGRAADGGAPAIAAAEQATP